MWQPDRGHQHPWVVTILGARPFYNSNLEFCSDKKSGNCEFEDVSVGDFEENFGLFVVCPDMAVWCTEKASVCGGGAWISGWWVVNTEEPQLLVAVQNPSKLRRNVLMISPDGEGQSDSTSVNLISCSPEWILTPITQSKEVQQTCLNPIQVVRAGRPTAPVVEGVENGLSRYTPILYTSWFIYTGWSPSMVSTCWAGKQGSGIVTDGAYSFTAELPIWMF